ncbi:MAG: hypothetical protein JXQ75_24300 [Phycisphaerae bacterium]|nr:hypothetical protein [Phycisphaerae bacterium]
MRRYLAAVLLLCLLIMLVLKVGPSAGRYLLQRVIVGRLRAGGFRVDGVEVTGLGLHRADLARLTLRGRESRSLRVGHVCAVYAPSRLLRGWIDEVHLSGVEINVARSGDQLMIAGLEPLFEGGAVSAPGLLPIATLTVSNSEVRVHTVGPIVHMPFSLEMRADPDRTAAEGTIRCANLEIEPLLAVMGWEPLEASGELGGSVDFRIRDGVVAGQGRLETAAGKAGRIAVNGDRFLTKYLPPADPRFTYVSIAEEALKDFRCDWARLDVSSSNGLLNVELQIRGAPAGRLPFSFDLRRRTFVRTTPEKSNANFGNGVELHLRFIDLSIEDILSSGHAVGILLED